MKYLIRTFLFTALAALAPVGHTFAVVLLTDDFTVTSNSQDVNQELELRQTGPLAPFTYTSGGAQHQVGNEETDVGQPDGVSNSDYLLLAFSSNFYSDFDIGTGLAKGAPITISFDMYLTGNPGGGNPDDWGAFTLRAPGNGWPVAGDGEFGMLMRNDGRMQMFQNADPANGAWDTLGYSTDSHWELTFSDLAGTGSAFDGNGSLLTFTNGANSESVALNQLNSSGLRLGFRNFDNMFIGIDNLMIEGAETLIGDLNDDGLIDLDDLTIIADNFYTTPPSPGQLGDANFDGFVDEADFAVWRTASGADPATLLGAVPEPTGLLMGAALIACGAASRGRRRS